MKKIEDYGLKEIPFKSQGTHIDKYPFVPSTVFIELTGEIDRVLSSQDSRGMLVRGPQGSGKTATRSALVKKYDNTQDQIVISQKVKGFIPRGILYSFQTNLIKQGLITKNFLDEIGYDETEDLPEKLEEWFEKIIREILLRGRKCLWIVDEFDLISISKDATPEEYAMRKPFLHLFSDVLEMISDVVAQEDNQNGFCTVLEQTESSAMQFRDWIVDKHTPLAQRLSGTSFDLAYDLIETLQICHTRLEVERNQQFSVGVEAEIKEKINNNKYFPLTKETLEWLYNAVTSEYVSEKLNQFRFYEQVLAKSFDIALEKDSETVTKEIVEEVFREKRDLLASTIPTQTGVNLPLQKKNEWEKIINDSNHEVANNFYLDGIVKGIKNWAQIYNTVEGIGAQPIVQPSQGKEIYMSKIKIDFTFTSTETIPSKKAGAKPKITQRVLQNSIVWYCASKTKNSFTDSDYEYVNTIIENFKEEDLGTQKTFLTVFDDITTKDPAEIKKIISVIDEVFIQHPLTKNDLVGINIAEGKEINTFRETYDKQINPISQNYLGTNIRNIGKVISKKEKILIQISQCMSLAGRDVKRSELIERAIGASEHKKIAPSDLNGIGLAGFLNPDTNSAEIPSNLKKLRTMIDKGYDQEKIIEKFGNEHTIKVAKTLGLIKEVEEST